MIPRLTEAGYQRGYAVGMIAASGSLGILIPPSVPQIIYAAIAEISVADVFMTALGPGLLLTGAFSAYVVWVGDSKRTGPRREREVALERWPAIRRAIPVLILPVLILGSIYTGFCTPTESAAIACAYSLILSLTLYRKRGGESLLRVLASAANVSATILLIMTATSVLSYIITINQVPLAFREWITAIGLGTLGFLLCVNVLLLALGCFVEIISVILITVPIMLPVLKSLDINLLHFAIILIVNMELGVITPPVGMNLFAVSAISKTPLQQVLRGTLPFALLMLGMLLVFTYVEPASMFTYRLFATK